MTNFDLFTKEQDFAPFAEPAAAAERIYQIDSAACVLTCRRAMEAAVKWMYSVDGALVMPYQDNLISLLSTDEFREIVDESLHRRLEFIRKIGNAAAHAGRKITKEQAALCLAGLVLAIFTLFAVNGSGFLGVILVPLVYVIVHFALCVGASAAISASILQKSPMRLLQVKE